MGNYSTAVSSFAEIDAETRGRSCDLGRRSGNRDMQVEIPPTIDQLGRAGLALAQLSAHRCRHQQSPGDTPFRADSQRGGLEMLTEKHRARVISDRRMRLDVMELVGVAKTGRADLRMLERRAISRF